MRAIAERPIVPTFVPLTSKGSGAPFFLLHPTMPMPWCYAPLVEHAPWDRPVYASRGVELDLELDLLDTRDLVSQYLVDIRRVQPKGPYLIGGWSFGGLLAFEIARRLVLDGQVVRRLILFDTYAPPSRLNRWRRQLRLRALASTRPLLRSRLGRTVLERTQLVPPAARALLLLRVDRPLSASALREIIGAACPDLSSTGALTGASYEQLCHMIVERLRPLIPKGLVTDFERGFPAGGSVEFVRYHHLQWKNHWLHAHYQPSGVYPSKITIYASTDNDHVTGWQRLSLDPLEIRRVPVAPYDGRDAHSSFFHPRNVELFAADVSRVVQTM